MTIVEGAAIVILSVSILWMLWAKRTGRWSAGGTAEEQTPALPIEELRQLMEESQVITQDLAGNLKEKKMISRQLLEQLDEKINKLTWLLGRAEEVSAGPRPTENPPMSMLRQSNSLKMAFPCRKSSNNSTWPKGRSNYSLT